MPSPVAHAVSGYALTRFTGLKSSNLGHKITPAFVFYAVFVAIAADFDFIPQLMTGANFHRGFTHSLMFAVIFSCVLSGIVTHWRKLPYKWVLAVTLMLYLSHLVLDFFTQGGSGIPLLWPFVDQPFKSSISLFPAVHHSRGLLDRSHLVFISFELTYAVLLFLGTWLWQGPRPSKKIKRRNIKP
ncbi:MAG: metal-dependent hydrolase [Cyanobacteria bacterium P01_D01_bin.44]